MKSCELFEYYKGEQYKHYYPDHTGGIGYSIIRLPGFFESLGVFKIKDFMYTKHVPRLEYLEFETYEVEVQKRFLWHKYTKKVQRTKTITRAVTNVWLVAFSDGTHVYTRENINAETN